MKNEILFMPALLDVSPRPGVHVLAADVTELESDELFHFALERISPQRREVINKVHRRTVQDLHLGATLLLDRLLRRHGLYERDMRYDFSTHGKPSFADYPHLAFNLSHSGTMALAALMPQPLVSYTGDAWRHADPPSVHYKSLGADIQRLSTVREHLAGNIFPADELEAIRTAANPDETFTRLWARHESHVKATGLGIQCPLPPLPPEADLHEYTVGKYSISICLL